MEHNQARELIQPYADGELDVSNARAVEQHLQTCNHCRLAEQDIRALRSALRSEAVAFRAPNRLRRNIGRAVRREARGDRGSLSWSLPWISAAAACALMVIGLFFFQSARSSRSAIVDQVIGNHVRSLLATHLVDVPSSDQHTVKPWFNGKIDFAPEVHDFAAEGFPLVGGRLDYLDGKTVAALVYRRDRHVINLLLTPTTDHDTDIATFTRRGYNLINWTRAGIEYWAVSDLNGQELGRLVTLIRAPNSETRNSKDETSTKLPNG
jgi:anti-sigma factor RsiW